MMEQMSLDDIQIRMISHLNDQNKADFDDLVDELQPYDLAQLYVNLPKEHRNRFISYLPDEEVTLLVEELDKEEQLSIFQLLGVERSSTILDLMENDELADLLNEVSSEQSEGFLSAMKREESQTVQRLMSYAPDTAGGIMTNRYVWIGHNFTVQEAIEKIRTFAKYAENIYYLYVLDENKKLVGVVSYRDLVLAGLGVKIKDIMHHRVISVPVDLDQEKVAQVIQKYGFIALPVVDRDHHLVGIVTVDDIIDVIVTEADEDIQKLSASSGSIDFRTRTLPAAMRRLPWLILLLFLGLLSGSVISTFEHTLQQVVALAFFMPMIAGMTGNTGTQSLAIVVRGLVSDAIDKQAIVRLIARELGVGLIIGIICGGLVSTFIYLWQGNLTLSFVVGSSLLLTLIIGTLAGTIIPLVLYKMKVDPAIASGPLITTLNDIFSLFIYFGLATLFISQL